MIGGNTHRRKYLAQAACLGLALVLALLPPWQPQGQAVQAGTRALPYIGGEYPISDFSSVVPASGEHPAGAYNPRLRQSLVAWESLAGARAIAARRTGEDSQALGEAFLVTTDRREQLRPAVAYNAADREFLVVWMLDVYNDGSRYEIWGQRLSETGQPVDSPFLISADRSLSLWSPRLVWAESSNQYMVVWETRDPTDTPTSIGMKLLLANGDSIAGITLSASGVEPEAPDVVFNWRDREFLIVWTQQNQNGSFSLTGSRRDLYGNRVGASPFAIFTSDRYLSNSRVTWNAQGYGAVFELAYTSSDHDLYLSSFDPANGVFPAPASLAATWREERFPQISIQGGQPDFIIVFRVESTGGTQLWLHSFPTFNDGSATGSEILLCDRADWSFVQPALVSGSYGAQAVYAGGLTGAAPHVYARGLWPIQAYLPIIQTQ